MTGLLSYQFIQYAIISGLFASILAGIVGVIINEKKMGIMAGGIAHASYGGIGLGFLLNFEPIIGAFVFALITAISVSYVKDRMTGMKDIIIAMFWSVGMALGVLFIAMKPGYPPNISSYLFGNILTVTTVDLYSIIGITIIITLVTVAYFQEIKAHLFDSEFLRIKHRNIKLQETLFMIFTALAVVVLIRVVGIILVIALISIPAATAGLFTRSLHTRIIVSSVLTFIYIMFGLMVSYITNLPTGAVIVLLGFIIYLLSNLLTRVDGKRKA